MIPKNRLFRGDYKVKMAARLSSYSFFQRMLRGAAAMSDLNLKIRRTYLRLPKALLSAWARLLNWTRDGVELVAQARTYRNRGSRMWE
jgi:hypothetical protein